MTINIAIKNDENTPINISTIASVSLVSLDTILPPGSYQVTHP